MICTTPDGNAGGGIDRRAFVKGAMAAGAAGAALAAGYAVAEPLSPLSRGDAKVIDYVGAKNVEGPAPRALPLLPVEVANDGTLRGKPTFNGGSVLQWYQYCGHQRTPGLQEDWQGDDTLVYHVAQDKLVGGYDPWFRDRLGEPVRADHFTETLQGAAVAWRSEGMAGKDVITAILLKVDPERVALEGVDRALLDDAGLAHGFLAYVSFCVHFCCVPGWKEAEKTARTLDAWDDILCTCHNSVYDPYTVVEDDYLLILEED